MPNNKRDPRRDPKAGDVVLFGPQWQTERYEVMGLDDNLVSYKMNGAFLWTTIGRWREWAAGGEVLSAAD